MNAQVEQQHICLQIREGNKTAFEKIFNEYKKRLYGYIYQKTESDFYASEVVQMTFMKLWERRACLKPDISFDAQLFQMTKTTLIDVMRKTEKMKEKEQRLQDVGIRKAKTGYEKIDEGDLLSVLNNIMKQMPPMRQRVFHLKVHRELSYKEISSALSISVKTVNKHMELAMQQVKPFFKTFLV